MLKKLVKMLVAAKVRHTYKIITLTQPIISINRIMTRMGESHRSGLISEIAEHLFVCFLFFRLPSFQPSETEHELNVKGAGPWCDLLFVMTSLVRCINNVGAGKYALLYTEKPRRTC